MSSPAPDDWLSMCEHWRALAREHYEPLPTSQCKELIQETLEATKTHKLVPEDLVASGDDPLGWRDWVRLDDDGHFVRFTVRKTLSNAEIKQVVDRSWLLYDDGDLYKKAHLDDTCKLFHQTLQRISPDALIIQRVVKYPNLVLLTHSLALVFRVQTETGYMFVIRCIESPQLQRVMKAEGLSLGESFTWDTYDVAHRDTHGECDAILFTARGAVGSDNPTYAQRWHDELLNALKRYENELKDTAIVSVEPSTTESGAVRQPSATVVGVLSP
jgi:hypothetical protein